MLATHWPLFGLTVTHGSVTLRLPTDDEAASLAGVAADGVHAEGERPFLTPWTERGARSRSRFVRDGEVVVSDRLRLCRADWQASQHGEGVSVTGLDPCGSMFGMEEGFSRTFPA